MKCLLLTRHSSFQRYCADRLNREGLLSTVVVEEGMSFVVGDLTLRDQLWVARWALRRLHHPLVAFNRLRRMRLHGSFYGRQDYHDQRLLHSDCEPLDPGPAVLEFPSVNDADCADKVAALDPNLVFVFGTGLIRKRLLDALACPVVNMHWGWSPDYRGDGLVSALAAGGVGHLGVTVHLLNPRIDGGEILYRERPRIDREDNFYSIGLKLAKLGTDLFVRAARDLERDGELKGETQDLSKGELYTGKHMDMHPELYLQAWRNLAKAKAEVDEDAIA